MTETKSEKFYRLRDKRLPKIVAAIKLIGNLAGPGYEYTVTEAQEIISAIDTQTAALARKFKIASFDKPTAAEHLDPAILDPADLSPAEHRKKLDRAIIHLKIDRTIAALEGFPELFKKLKEEIGA